MFGQRNSERKRKTIRSINFSGRPQSGRKLNELLSSNSSGYSFLNVYVTSSPFNQFVVAQGAKEKKMLEFLCRCRSHGNCQGWTRKKNEFESRPTASVQCESRPKEKKTNLFTRYLHWTSILPHKKSNQTQCNGQIFSIEQCILWGVGCRHIRCTLVWKVSTEIVTTQHISVTT